MNNFRVLTLTQPDVENGLGCRVTIWASGCTHKCLGCHNQHTWKYGQGVLLTDKNVVNTIYEKVSLPYISGITLSGGDPLDQSDNALKELLDFLIDFKKNFPDKDIWIYSGYTFEQLCENEYKKEILKLCDILVDGKFQKELYDCDIAFRGSKNQRIIDLRKTFESNEIFVLRIG